MAMGLVTRADAPQWLGEPHLAMPCVIIVNAWRFFPFSIVIFLAGISAVPQDVLDDATVDGAGFWRRNYQMIMPSVVVGLIFGIVFTFTDLSIVYLLTSGGPVNATQVLGTSASRPTFSTATWRTGRRPACSCSQFCSSW